MYQVISSTPELQVELLSTSASAQIPSGHHLHLIQLALKSQKEQAEVMHLQAHKAQLDFFLQLQAQLAAQAHIAAQAHLAAQAQFADQAQLAAQAGPSSHQSEVHSLTKDSFDFY